MIHLQEALSQVRELQNHIIEKQRFKGYSGGARALGGTCALAITLVMSSQIYPQAIGAHIYGWMMILLIAAALNFGAMVKWFLFDPTVKRDLRRLRPLLDEVPALAVGGLLTFMLVRLGLPDLIQSIWLLMLGISCLAARHALPRYYWCVGAFYLLSGALSLLDPTSSFLHPLRTGFILFIGEWTAGVVLHFDEGKTFSLRSILDSIKNSGDRSYV